MDILNGVLQELSDKREAIVNTKKAGRAERLRLFLGYPSVRMMSWRIFIDIFSTTLIIFGILQIMDSISFYKAAANACAVFNPATQNMSELFTQIRTVNASYPWLSLNFSR